MCLIDRENGKSDYLLELKANILQLSSEEGIGQVINISRLNQTAPLQSATVTIWGGSISEKCNELAKHLWHFCIQ